MSYGQQAHGRGRATGPFRLHPAWYALLVAVLVAVAGFVAWREAQPVVHRIDGYTMGSTWSVSFVGPRDADAAAVHAALDVELAALDRALSGYRDDSALVRLNRAPVGEWVDVPRPLAEVLAFGVQLWRESDGAFDMTVKPLVALWGFGNAAPRDSVPTAAEIAAARALLGSDRLELSADGRRARRLAEVAFDTDGVAPGYAAGVLSARLAALGYPAHLVEVGGEMRASGRRPDGRGWRVGVEAPEMARGNIARVVEVSDAALTTAGDYRDYFEVDGVRYQHILDPASGWPVNHGLASVTVIAPGLASADGYATAIMVLGPERGMRFAEAQGLAVHMILRRADGALEERYNPAFEPYLAD